VCLLIKYSFSFLLIFLHNLHSNEIAFYTPSSPPSKIYSVPNVLVLNDCGIDQAGKAEELRKKCYSVKELDLAQNKLENWNEVKSFPFTSSSMPKLKWKCH
jgi:hypothetical protein